MKIVWGRMRVPACVLVLAAWAIAEDSQDRRSKLPFIADAVGNALPPPSNVPATVGSPVNLLTPDRYEFYTFDESGELVKRLMTLEEIQAIVAAGEETESLVTFANDNQPTIAFNFSQPPYTKVHSVVSNVQNVLKAQMEAHKNKPQTQPPLDTPDVSDSWSLILPSIFGNTGVDIVPDKTSGSFITPETDTIEFDLSNFDAGNSLSKEGTNTIPTSSTTGVYEKINNYPATEKIPEKSKISTKITTTIRKPMTTSTTSTTTTTIRSTTAKRRVPTTTTSTTTTTAKPRTTISTTKTPIITTTTTVKSKPLGTTNRPHRTTPTQYRRTTVTTTTSLPSTERSSSTAATTRRTIPTKPTIIDDSSEIPNIFPLSFGAVLDSRKPVQYEKVGTFVPNDTVTHIAEGTTKKPLVPTKIITTISTTAKQGMSSTTTTSLPKVQSSTDKPYVTTNSYLNSIVSEQEYDKINSTTITTQSVSPSTTVTSTELINLINNKNLYPNTTVKEEINGEYVQSDNNTNDEKDNKDILPLFDVAQSISQIASDLGGNYAPLPTTSLLDTTKPTNMNVESKENLEIDIPTDNENEQNISNNDSSSDNFIKISTLDPNDKNDNKTANVGTLQNNDVKVQSNHNQPIITIATSIVTSTSTSTTIDPILSESMEDLMSQVVHSAQESIVRDKNQNSQEILKPENEERITETNENKNQTDMESIAGATLITESSTTGTSTTLQVAGEIYNNKSPLIETNDINTFQKYKAEQNESVAQNVNYYDNKSAIPNPELSQNENQNKVLDIPNSTIKFEKTQIDSEKNATKQPVAGSVKTETYITTAKDFKVESETSTETLPKLESTTVKLGSTTRQQASTIPFNKEKNHFTSSVDKNGLINKNQKEKEPVIYPKVDEFKKKIQKVNIDDKELANERNNSWKLISTVTPPKANEVNKEKHKNDELNVSDISEDKNIVLDFSKENQGLEVTTKDLGEDIAQFTELCNELAFQYWIDIVKDIDKKRSFVLSPYSITSMLAMMFMGARGSTSGEMNEILKLDDMVTFNPHFTLKNISDSIETSSGSGIAISAFIRELYSDRSKGKILTFYKERAQQFYNGHVEEINFKLISDIIRRRTNLLVKRYTWGKIIEYMKTNNIIMNPPLAAFSANIFQTDCSSSSVEGRDGEMYFVVSPNVRQRRLVPVPAVVYRSNFLAGYDPVLDATAAALGNTNSVISTLFLMPGQQGNVVHADDLEALEKRLLDSNTTPTWNRLLRTLLPRVGLELQIPRFSHKSIFNISSTLRRMGLKDLFDHDHADLGGLNGPSKDLYLSDMIQTTTFVTCGEGIIAEQHHIEEYPETLDSTQKRRAARWIMGWDEPRDYQRAFHDPHDVSDAMHLPLHLRPRQARLPSRNAQPARLKFDRPFLFFVRHNPSGMILYVGRYNPRLLP